MRRTTICRSRGARLAAAAALIAAAAPLVAQQPPPQPAPQPAVQQAPAPQQAAAGQGQQSGPPPATHVVEQGETLWSLAERFLGDPLLWPEIFRLNTDVVEDPHWIFPGEELRLVAAADTTGANLAVTPEADTVRAAPEPAPAAPEQPLTVFAPVAARTETQGPIEVLPDNTYRAVRAGEYYSSGFIAEDGALRPGALVASVERAALSRVAQRSTAALFGEVVARVPPGDTVRSGDMLLVYTVADQVRGYGDLVVPSGLLRVSADGLPGADVTATVVAVFEPVLFGQRLIKIQPFVSNNSARPQPVDSGVVGEVIALRSDRQVLSTQAVLFINRGSDSGVRLGDIFTIGTPGDRSSGGVARRQAEVMVVNVRAATATCTVLQVSQPDVFPGAVARQVRRMPS